MPIYATLWHVELLLGNESETSNYTTATAMQTTIVAWQWLSSDHVGTPTDTNATSLQQRNGVFCVVCAEML
jgi:hypothetical protein